MDDSTLRRRLNAVLLLLAANALLLFGIGLRNNTRWTIGVAVLAAIVGLGRRADDDAGDGS
ncbi:MULTISPECIES: hypothetical protein [unclassified Halorubrum]|jgi:hypothetical protein|uniref:hypothetical protein n=1 Tax=unclassified Halorubrum TaxID=2642239 RepID=UPI0010F58034|nr:MULTISPECIES: hypothetical protein [unclassified Halorubrum]TKX45683.1 hypothetical protein EXE50_00335 [Halorubrum sp. ARQ200]TKX51240.1 hypothetical protein EXE49_03185 [Halorubrum sp. ASP121]TKX63780.1 hypothetical protein EXE48_01970 [Halorubrum sp. ASP1]